MAAASGPSNQGNGALSSFPFLTNDEFESGCWAFSDRVQTAGKSAVAWASVRFQKTGSNLKIIREFDPGCELTHDDLLRRPADTENSQVSQLDLWEDDPETVIRTSPMRGKLQVDYDILLSSTYQVPVLYFTLRRENKPLGLEEVYDYLVPDQYRNSIRSVGIMGGISFGYHPLSGIPAFFVHPCNTAEAMRDIASGHEISPETYVIIWLGLVGNCVRLQLPTELFETTGIPKLRS